MDDRNDLTDHLPLTETTFLILLSLSANTRHGYAIMKDVESLSAGRVKFSTGTLYGAIRRMLQDGWIERVDEDRDASLSGERNKKYYSLTHTGKQILDVELKRLRELVSLAELRTSEMKA